MAKNNKKPNYQAFVNAIKASGKLMHYDLGGGVNLGQGTLAGPSGPNAQTTQGGIGGFLTPQSTFQAQVAPTTQLNYTPAINQSVNQALAGYGQAQDNIGSEQALEQQFLQQAAGQGPNPAQAQLAQATGSNVANQAALAASQRGASANAGLVARQAAQAGGAAQQTAAGQSATLQAQQEVAAQQAAAAQQAQIGQQVAQQQANSTNLFGTTAGAQNTQNANIVSNYGQANNANAQTAAANATAAQKTTGGLLGSIGSIFGLAKGGEVPTQQPAPQPQPLPGTDDAKKKIQDSFNNALHFDQGGNVGQVAPMPSTGSGATSWAGKFLSDPTGFESLGKGIGQLTGANQLGASLKGMFKSTPTSPATTVGSADSLSNTGPGSMLAGGQGEAATSPLLVDAALLAAKGGKIPKPVVGEQLASKGLKVPGEASVKGDSLKNDTVPAMLSPGEIVLPKSVTDAPDAPQRALKFVQAIQAKQRSKRK